MAICTVCGADGRKNVTDSTLVSWECPKNQDSPCEPCLKISELELRIQQTKSLLVQLVEERRSLQTHRNREHDPMGKLPPEIVSSIFTFCGAPPRSSRIKTFGIWKLSLFSQVLGRVCRRWREIAQATPQLWTNITLSLETAKANWQTERTKERISRSGHLPLSISLFMSNSGTSPFDPHPFHTLIDLLNGNSWRWRDISASIPYSLLSRLRPDKHGIPMLTDMTIRACDCRIVRQAFPFDFGPITPSLVSVDFCAFFFASIVISWRTVVRVHLGTLSVGEFFELFQQGPNITECNIDSITGGDEEHLNPSDELIHCSLRQLALGSEGDVSGMHLSKLLVPSLQSLNYNEGRASVLRAVLAPSSSLISLSIKDVAGTEEEILEILHMTPSLERLRVYQCPLANQFLHTLAATTICHRDDEGQRVFLPSLKDLIWDDVSQRLSWHLIPLLFPSGPLSSTGHQRPLKRVEIAVSDLEDDDYIEEEVLKEILGILKRGIELVITNAADDDLIAHSQEYYESLDSREGTDQSEET
ncbi:unnamed protein product [Cyclocybe aegerita]|uniref:F-box domain-containing protein n=1 Tax=Cyclocybe aegerita TaxID=1973307 RepID=A0A8S0WIS1_CYCAE|nr:unnamed protein product [Cyclocybe aegerita]